MPRILDQMNFSDNQSFQSFHEKRQKQAKNYERIHSDIQNLCDLPQSFSIKILQQTHIRIVLQIQYCEQSQKIKFDSQKQLLRSKLQQYEIHNNYKQKQYIFTCIIDFDVYPFMPPYLVMSRHPGFLKLNDFRNIVSDILGNKLWFPIFKLHQIFIKIPDFVAKLNIQDSSIKGNYYYQKSFKKSDIQKFAQGLKLCTFQIYQTKDVLIGKYQQKIVGISFKSLIIFQKDQINCIRFVERFSISQINSWKIEENQKRFKFTIKFNNKKNIILKLNKILILSTIIPHFLLFIKLVLYFNEFQQISKQIDSRIDYKINKSKISLHIKQTIYCLSKDQATQNTISQSLGLQKIQYEKMLIKKNQLMCILLEIADLVGQNELIKYINTEKLNFFQNKQILDIICKE